MFEFVAKSDKFKLSVTEKLDLEFVVQLTFVYYVFISCKYKLQYITTLFPSVNTIAPGMLVVVVFGAKYTHHTFSPIIKHH